MVGIATPNNLGSGLAVRVCNATVQIIIINARSTILSAPSTLNSVKCKANADDTAAATMPLGPQQTKAFS